MEHYISKTNWCVYYHRSRTSGKYYVGITKNTKTRWHTKGHDYTLCPHLWYAIQKYGWDDFDHIILLKDLTKEQAKMIQVYLIEKFNLTNPLFGYNLSKGGDGGNGLFGSDHPLSRKVYQYSFNGDYIQEWDTMTDAYTTLNIRHGYISEAAQGLRDQAGGYQWSFEKVDKMLPFSGFINNTFKKYPKIYRVNFDGQLEKTYDRLQKIQDFSHSEYEKVRQCCVGTKLSYCGSFWMFEEDYNQKNIQRLRERKIHYTNRPVLRFHCGEYLERFSTIKQAIEKSGGSVGHAVRSASHFAYGDTWIFEDQYSELKDQLNLEEIDLEHLES